MNLIETMYCSQYCELKKTGRDPAKGRTNATVLTAAMILLILISVGVVIDHFDHHHPVSHFFRHGVGESVSGRTIGRMVGLGGLALIGVLLNFTYGSEKRYRAMMDRWEQLPEEEVQGTRRKAMITFGVVFVIFLLSMALNFI